MLLKKVYSLGIKPGRFSRTWIFRNPGVMAGFPVLLSLLLLSLWKSNVSSAADVNFQFNIVNADTAPDGFTRNAILVNNQNPGTLIQANKNDVLHINVSVQLTNPAMRRSVSIHVGYSDSYMPLLSNIASSGMVWYVRVYFKFT